MSTVAAPGSAIISRPQNTQNFAAKLAWVSTAGVAYVAILKGNVAVHKEWMVRAYVVTFAFVTFRLLHDYGPTSRLMPENDRTTTVGWACWACRFW